MREVDGVWELYYVYWYIHIDYIVALFVYIRR